jgi:hypothetical protein
MLAVRHRDLEPIRVSGDERKRLAGRHVTDDWRLAVGSLANSQSSFYPVRWSDAVGDDSLRYK